MKKYNTKMKLKTIVSTVLFLYGFTAIAQVEIKTESKSKEFQLGDGLRFNVNDGDYKFKIGGFIQGVYQHDKTVGSVANNYMNARNAFFTLSGSMMKEKVSFLLQNNFSSGRPLLDAWVSYSPVSNIKITFGQKQAFTNNREMTFFEDKLQFVDRGIFSLQFSNLGREFGVFLESEFSEGDFIIKPKIAITSGDGLNSFGANSTDVDRGGLKYGGRIDILPLGKFKEGNDKYIADLKHEDQLKILVGAAYSYNIGASNKVGEGHGDFMLYNNTGKSMLPDYRKFYEDILLKYKGFSLLTEYTNTTATSLSGSYLDAGATRPLYLTEISEYLVLGDGYNVQAGYVTKSGLALDVRYEKLNQEFDNNLSLLLDQEAYTLGLTKYFKGNNFKIQGLVSSNNLNQFNSISSTIEKVNTITAQLAVQVVF
jgi:hypothetical protein